MHASKEVQAVEEKYIRTNLPAFRAGDTVRGKDRIQYVEGVVIRKSGNGITKTFTLRKISNGVGVEIIYPMASATVSSLEVVSQGDVRRARLYYLRGLSGKAARVKTKDTLANAKKNAVAKPGAKKEAAAH
ncbi:MAG: 50S ribosomal protein L19 [Proteobacteria bacterium]|nr:MAG: 50S ribosomal protein L19 [Pseudomonadota bacterium]